MWKASFKVHGVILMALAAEVCSMACKVGIFDICNNNSEPTIPEKAPPPRSDFLYFQNAGDIKRMTISKDDKLTEISLINGSVIRKNRDGLVEIHGKNNESITVNMHTLEVTVSALDCADKIIIKLDITKYVAYETLYAICGINQRTDVSVNEQNEMTIHSSFALIVFRKAHGGGLLRPRAPSEDIYILGYQEGTAYERRNSDDVYLIKDLGTVWEEMYIQPENLLLLAMNHLGALYFHPNQSIVVKEWDGTRVSGSPFSQKFGRIIEKNVTRQVTFDADGCGMLEVYERTQGKQYTLITHPSPRFLKFAVDEANYLEVEGKTIYWKNGMVDLSERIVRMMRMTGSPLETETKKWTVGADTVEHFDERYIEDVDYVAEQPTDSDIIYKPAHPFTWKMNFEIGSVDLPTGSSMPHFRFFPAYDGGIANITYRAAHGFDAIDIAGEMRAYCHHTTKLRGSGGEMIEMGGNSFLMSASAATVHLYDNKALVQGLSGVFSGGVLITPFKIDLA